MAQITWEHRHYRVGQSAPQGPISQGPGSQGHGVPWDPQAPAGPDWDDGWAQPSAPGAAPNREGRWA